MAASSSAHWRTRLNSFKNNLLGSPRFHRRKLQGKCSLWFFDHLSHVRVFRVPEMGNSVIFLIEYSRNLISNDASMNLGVLSGIRC